MSEKAHLDAVVALLTAADAIPQTLQELADTDPLPTTYNEVTVTQRELTGPRRNGAPSETTQWRVTVRSVAQRYGNAQEMRARAYAALHEATLTVGAEKYHVEMSTSPDPIGPDDGWFSGVIEFTY